MHSISDDTTARALTWLMVRRPLLLLFAMGAALSLSATNSLNVRVTVDGMISFLFLPAAGFVAAGLLYIRSDRHMPFAHVVDGFFASNYPWLLWLLVFSVWEVLTQGRGNFVVLVWVVVITLVVPALWTFYLDLQFFRVVLSRRAVIGDLVLTRAVSWFAALAYFGGIAVWAQIVAWLR